MLALGVILLLVGALVAYLGAARDPAIRVIGLIVAVIGLVLVVVAVIPGDTHAAAAVVLVPSWRRRAGGLAFWVGIGVALLAGCAEAVWLLLVDQVRRPSRARVAVERRFV